MRPRSRSSAVRVLAAGVVPLLWASAPGGMATAAVLDGCLDTRSTVDLNGDGFDDTAVGDPTATVDGHPEAGRVTVLFGDADGRIGEGLRLVLTQADLGGVPENGDHFGAALEVGVLTADHGCAGLVIGSPGEDVEAASDAGTVHLVRFTTDDEGRPDGVQASALSQADAGGTVEPGDEFGFSLAVSGPTADDPRRLLVGAPGETVAGAADAGSVSVFSLDGTAGGLGELRQGRRAPRSAALLPGSAEAGDRFGATLVVGLLRLTDPGEEVQNQGLVIGAPGDTVAGHPGGGSITALPEQFGRATLITQNSTGVPGTVEDGDAFGASLALSPRSGNRPRDLAVGVPGEDIGAVTDAGMVTLFRNTEDRLVPGSGLTQNTRGVPGRVESGDRFGAAVVAGWTDETVLIGVPGEDLGTVTDAGSVQPVVVPTAEFALRFRDAITEDGADVPGAVGPGHRFGHTLGAITGVRENVLLIAGTGGASGAVVVLSDGTRVDEGGSPVDLPPREWRPGEGDLPAGGAADFGQSLDR